MLLAVVAAGTYLAAVYATANSADRAADIQNENIMSGLLRAQANRTLDLVERLAVSDRLVQAIEKNQPHDELKNHCGQSSNTKLKSVGLLSAELSIAYLCEYGDEKTASEQSYLAELLEPYAKPLFQEGSRLIAQTGHLQSDFIFDQQYISYSGDSYILTLAVVAPETEGLTSNQALHLVFSLENISQLITRIGAEFLALKLVPSQTQTNAFEALHSATFKRNSKDVGISVTWSRSAGFRQHMLYVGPILLVLVIIAGTLMILALRRIQNLHTSLVKQEAKSRFEAQHDQMTGLLNRKRFYELLDDFLSEATESEPVFVGIFDLDKFKSVNDSFGHHAGDHLIIETAHRLVSVMRDENIAARLGGDEFAFAIKTCSDAKAAEALVNRLLVELKRDVWMEGMQIQPSASIGVAAAPYDTHSRHVLLKKADVALYEVKEAGRGAVKFYHETQTAECEVVHIGACDGLVA